MALVKFVTDSAANFISLSQKDEDTLYFITDQQKIYKGSTLFSGGVYTAVAQYPEHGEINTIYVNTTDGSVRYWNGTGYQQMVKPTKTAISGAGDDLSFPTTKAIVDYVATKIQDLDVSAIAGRLDTIEGQIATINGSGEGSIKKGLQDAKAYTDELKAGQVEINKNKITALETGKADKATTLAGYGIDDAYTKTDTDKAIAKAVSEAPHLKRTIVESLEGVAKPDENTIYMVAKGAGADKQAYDEYMYINQKWEKLGDTEVDLTNYATKIEVSTAKQEVINTAAGDATTKANKAKDDAIKAAATDAQTKANQAKTDAITAAGTAADEKILAAVQALDVADIAVAGQYVSAVTETDGKIKVTRAQLPSTPTLVEGTTNGTVKYNGTDVKVYGLASAAYAETTAFDAAGKADQALASAKQYVESLLTWGSLA